MDCPRSGWSISRMIIDANNKKLKRYFTFELCNFSDVKICTVTKIKKGFNNSIGCNLKKYKSSHRFAPLTSIPIIGTNAKEKKDMMNNGIMNF